MSILEGVAVRAGWKPRRFDRCFARSRSAGRPHLEPLSVFLDAGVVPRASRSDNHNELGADLANYLVVEVDDLVFNKLRSWQGGFGHSAFEGIVSPAYYVCRPLRDVSSRFADHLLHSAPYLAELTRVSKWQPPSQFDLPWEQLKTLRLSMPEYAEQVAIADFLDRECERIAVLERTLGRAAGLTEDIANSSLAAAMARAGVDQRRVDAGELPRGWSRPLLPRCLRQLTNGYVGPTRDILLDEGVRYIQSTHIKDGGIDFDRRPFYVSRAWFEARPRIQLQEDDVLIVQTGKLGEVALVPPGYGDAACHALLIARVNPDVVTGPYLVSWFRSEFGRAQLLRVATGALHPHLEAGEIRQLHVIVPPTHLQEEFVRLDAESRRSVRDLRIQLGRLRANLTAYRSALITEAVTGQIDVSAVSQAQMDERLVAVSEGLLEEAV